MVKKKEECPFKYAEQEEYIIDLETNNEVNVFNWRNFYFIKDESLLTGYHDCDGNWVELKPASRNFRKTGKKLCDAFKIVCVGEDKCPIIRRN